MTSRIMFLLLLAPALISGCSTDRFWETACGFLPRPQNPIKRAYIVREATIGGGAEGIQLAGELTMPRGGGPFPGVVLLSGTGPQDRNEKVLGHKPFLVLSDYLTRHGYAVFRYDDRGYGKSTGNHKTAVYEDFAADAAAALAWLKNLNEIDAEHSGYIGHSQGGSVAVIASFMEPAGFVVSLAGGVQTLAEVVLQQTLDQARVLHNSSEDELNETRRQATEVLNLLRSSESVEEAYGKVEALAIQEGLSRSQARKLAAAYANISLMRQLDVSEAKLLASLEKPVLELYGGKDLLVSAKINAPLTKALLVHPLSKVVTFAGLNHFFQPARIGGIEEVCEIDTTIEPVVLETIVGWLNEVTGR